MLGSGLWDYGVGNIFLKVLALVFREGPKISIFRARQHGVTFTQRHFPNLAL